MGTAHPEADLIIYYLIHRQSQKIGQDVLVVLRLAALRHRLENTELFCQLVIHLHYRTHVVATVAVVRSRPYRHQISRLEPKLETLLNQLMGSCYKFKSVDVVEVSDHFSPENPACPAVVRCPSFDVFWV